MKPHLLTGLILTIAMSGMGASNHSVPATANIYSAGLAAPVAPGGLGAGGLPVLHSLLPGETAFKFTAIGVVSEFPAYSHGPDGRPSGVDISPYGGISGFKSDRILPLVGVFLDANIPTSPAPPTLQFTSSGLGFDFPTLSPALGQVFFIGDGLTSGSIDQLFYAPAGATRLFLGFADAPNSIGAPGAYSDNSGVLEVTVTAVPEPVCGGLLLLGGVLLFARRKHHHP